MKTSNIYTQEQIKRVLVGSGVDIEAEFGNDFIIFCPYHNNNRTPAGEVAKDSGLFFCFGCQTTKNLEELIMHMSGRTYFESARFIKSKENESNLAVEIDRALVKEEQYKPFDELIIKRLHNNVASSERAKNYFQYRKLNQQSCSKFALGYSEKQDMVTVPVHSPDGMPIGIVGRSVEGKSFKNSTNLPKSKTLFNIHRAKRIGAHVIVVESSFDAIRVHQAGFPNVVATLGGFLSTEQHNLLNRHFDKITIMTDADQAGRELGKSIVNKLKFKDLLWASYEYGKIYPHDAKDAGDMTDEEIKTCIKNSVSEIEYRSWNS